MPENATHRNVYWSSNYDAVATVSSTGVVKGIRLGSADISAKTVSGQFLAKCRVTVVPPPYTAITPEAIDLGFPSRLKWASFNLGATKPEEYGDYFAWGETEPHYYSRDPLAYRPGKYGYSWQYYNWCMGSKNSIIKYCPDPNCGYNGFTDDKTVLDPEDDAATVILGDKWRMPTKEEQEELLANCTWEETSVNGVTGILATGPNGNSLFLPFAGYFTQNVIQLVGSWGGLWSSSLYTDDPLCSYYFEFFGNTGRINRYTRSYGRPIRPVQNE